MKKRCLITILVLIILIFPGCQQRGPEDEVEDEVFKGTKGLEMQFLKDLPSRTLYDTSSLNFLVEMENKGVIDLSGSNCMLYLSGFDDTIIRAVDKTKYCGSNLWAKSVLYPEGGFDTAEFGTDSINLPKGVDSLPQKFILTACYEYETIANPIVCIDPNLYKIRSIQEACTVKDVSTTGGQGAPVAVSRTEVDMVGPDKVAFKIHLSNVGGGTVLSKSSSIGGKAAHSCPFNLDYNDYNLVDYKVDMSGATLLKCSPNPARLVNGNGNVYCTFKINSDQTYTTPLRVNLRYNYMDSISKEVEILKTPE